MIAVVHVAGGGPVTRKLRTATILSVLLLCAAAAYAGAASPSIEQSWFSPHFDREFDKLVVIGISDDRGVRHHFEDKFISHLRGHGCEGVTSHSLVADLQKLEGRNQILDKVMDNKIDGAISVRLVPVAKGAEEDWIEQWAVWTAGDANLRSLIEETLPAEPTKASRFGVEIAIWDILNRHLVWSGRTGSHKMKKLRQGAGDLIEFTIDDLKDAGLCRRVGGR